jgi:RHS repeat-associated protein
LPASARIPNGTNHWLPSSRYGWPSVLQKQSILYSTYDKAREIRFRSDDSPTPTGHTTGYRYGPERQKFRRMDWFNNVASGASDATEYVGTTEILRPNGATYRDIRRRVGGAIVVNRIKDNGTESGYAVYYEFTDALGSPHRITDQWGQPYLDDGSQWFVPFGMRADAGNGDPLDAAERLGFPDSLTRHGWTGHEQADPVGVIQMGGRLYDAEAGRFVQPDPFVQDPFDGQSLNRYSYLLNNPLSGTDPSGYWGAKEQGYLRTVVAIVIDADNYRVNERQAIRATRVPALFSRSHRAHRDGTA